MIKSVCYIVLYKVLYTLYRIIFCQQDEKKNHRFINIKCIDCIKLKPLFRFESFKKQERSKYLFIM